MPITSVAGPKGKVRLKVRKDWPSALRYRDILKYALPYPGLPWEVFLWRTKNLKHLMRGLWRMTIGHAFGLPVIYGALWLRKDTPQGTIDYGLASLRVVTTVGAGAIVDAFQNIVELEDFKYHGIGSSSASESVSDTALNTEFTTQYPVDNTRVTGTQTENGSTVYRTVGSFDPDSAVTCREHGIFNNATVGSGVLLDRTVYSDVSVAASNETLQVTYDLTISAGS